jgi:putative oxygen-independent coproporphyrinogen III oxidase
VSLGIYVHWPYCSRICPYCDFNVYRARDRDEGPLLAAIIADMRGHAARMGAREAETLFLGGGTPSLLSPSAVERLISAAREHFALRADAEITLEANPEDHARFAGLVSAGVNRLSLGVQSLRDHELKKLGRAHDATLARAATEAAARTGARVSVDLIYARENQTPEQWRAELSEALALPVEHFSLYQLTIEEGTPFDLAIRRGAMRAPDDDNGAALYEITQELCDAAGFPAYEISNHARNNAARSTHNLIYWRSGEWLGLGPGAHGRVSINGARLATEAHERPEAYIAAVSANGVGWSEASALTAEEQEEERVLMGLRAREGVARAGLSADAITSLVSEGYIIATDDRVALSAKGRLLADRVSAELLG